jgi:hypothetical protein
MEPGETLTIEEVLRSQLGSSARWRLYDRTLDSPMNFVLARAERQLHGSSAVYWVDNSAPEMFSLRGFSLPVAVFGSRYVELWADIRATLTNDILRNFIPQITEQLTLRLIAELSLSHNDPEFAASMMLRSTMTGDGLSQQPNTIASLELEPIGTPYMAVWFYGLAHELGHFVPYSADRAAGSVSEADIVSAIDRTLGTWNVSDDLRAEGRSKARANPNSDILGVTHLRGEIHADVFATSVLFESTVEILEGTGSFQILGFISEMVLALNIVAIFDRCRRVAQQAVTATPRREHLLDTLLHPVSVAVRMKWVRWYLEMASARYLFGDTPSEEEHHQLSSDIDSVIDHLRPAIEGAEQGMAAALTVALDRERRGSFLSVLQQWRSMVNQPGSFAIEGIAIERFCALAASLGKDSPVFTMMLETVQNRSAPLGAPVEGEHASVYFCPWVDGPNEFSRPFGLNTRYGHMVFVFVSDGELFKRFCEVSAGALAEGYTLKSAVVAATTTRQLVEAITLRVRIGTQLRVVVEGTDEFERHMTELSNDTIWPE